MWQLDTATNETVPDVVTELPSLDNAGLVVDESAGTLTVRYELDPDAVWADGVPITGADLAFTYDLGSVFAPEWDALLGAWAPIDPGIIDLIYYHALLDDFFPNTPGWGAEGSLVRDAFSERYFELWEEIQRAVDDTDLWPLIAEAQEILSDQMIYLPLFQEPDVQSLRWR